MKHNQDTTPKWLSKIRFSIVTRLSVRLWGWLFATFILLDMILITAAFITVVIYAEDKIANVAPQIAEIETLNREDYLWLETMGIKLTTIPDSPAGFSIPHSFHPYLELANAQRKIRLEDSVTEWDNKWQRWTEQFVYRIEFSRGSQNYALDVDITPAMTIGSVLLTIVISVEVIVLITRIFSGTRVIRKTLSPLTELAKQAQKINFSDGPLAIEEMNNLAGKLDGINAAKLDERIDIEQTQDELKGVAVAINELLTRINEAYHSQARFVSDASHELRTPIAAIQGYANLLDRWGKHDEQALQESIDAIKEETTHMKELVEQLLFLARGDNNRMPLHLEDFDLKDLVETVIKEAEMIDGGHDFSSELNSVIIRADMALIKQAIRILVDNAIKYTPVGGKIMLSVSAEAGKTFTVVQDNGIGIPPDAVPKIFDRLFRADESRARATGGTGLGLSIAQWIVQRHGGHLEVLSREDLGTRITIVIPSPCSDSSRQESGDQ